MPWDDRIRHRLRLRDLDILMAVVDAGSMSKAAARFNLTQPAVTKVIADLEHTLGARLLNRSQRGVEPTPHGLALVKRGTAIFDELRHGVEDLDFLSDPTAGEIRIGCPELVASAIVYPVLDQMTQQYPRMAFHVVAAQAPALQHLLSDREVELAISRIASPVSEVHMAEILFHDTLVVATGVKNPLMRRRRIALADLANEPWLLPYDDMFTTLVSNSYHATGLAPPRMAVTTSSINLRNEMLATGRFLTVVPAFALRLPRRHPVLRALPVDLANSRHPVVIRTLKNRQLSPLAELFCERVRAIIKPLAKP
ncbi:MAG: LysR family transcriptional regulator [Hyphomicrobium sp.]